MSESTLTSALKPSVKTLSLSAIKPYWRNPRDNRAAVDKVKQSITEYGYNQLIAVDKKHVIIAGHTRYLALKALGWKEVSVMILDLDDKKAKAYRIIDNKTSEFAAWTDDLWTELRELGDMTSLQPFFNEGLKELVEKSAGADGEAPVSAKDVATSQAKSTARFGHGDVHAGKEKEVACPECGKQFFIRA